MATTASQLIAALQQLDPDTIVGVDNGDETFPIHSLERTSEPGIVQITTAITDDAIATGVVDAITLL